MEAVSEYVAREVSDYELLATNDLKTKEAELLKSWRISNDVVEQSIGQLPERRQKVLRCLIVRDMYHLLELYATYLRGNAEPSELNDPPSTSARKARSDAILPFSEWLFGDQGAGATS